MGDKEINLGNLLIRRGRIYGGVPRCEGIVRFKDLLGDLGTGLTVTSDRFRRQPGRSRAHANPVSHPRSKHIAIQYHFTRELVQTGQLIVKHIPTKAMVAERAHKLAPPSSTRRRHRNDGRIGEKPAR